MKKVSRKRWSVLTMLSCIVSLICVVGCMSQITGAANADFTINNLRVQHNVQPLAIEDEKPVFGWQMTSSVIGQEQSAYQIIVTKESDNTVVWDSGKVASGLSIDIRYAGYVLEPEAGYSWAITVWNAEGQTYEASSRFEMGIMNSNIAGWDGAEWIGTNELTLDATSACLFVINTDFQIRQGNTASVILGADDFRFSDRFLNIENVEGENFVRFELDISGLNGNSGAVMNVYRVGYGQGDSAETPRQIINVADGIITEANKNEK